jgi:hypothetical protein
MLENQGGFVRKQGQQEPAAGFTTVPADRQLQGREATCEARGGCGSRPNKVSGLLSRAVRKHYGFDVATAEATARSEGSWLLGIADAAGLGGFAIGVLSFLAMLLLFAVWEVAWGRVAAARAPGDPQDVIERAWVAVFHFIATAYLIAAWVHAQRVSDRSRSELLPRLAPGAETEAILDPSGDACWLRIAGALGLASAVCLSIDLSPGPVSYDPRTWSAETAWHRVLALAMGFLSFRLVALLLIRSRRLSRLVERIAEVDLLDLSGFAPLSRQGLANAALMLGYAAAHSFFLVDLAYLPVLLTILVSGGLFAAVGFLIPLRGAQRRIRTARDAELAWCRQRIREARGMLERGSQPSRIEELLSWEARIEAVREWPIDARALRRLGLYLLIPLLSWSGGALVERGIENLLDRPAAAPAPQPSESSGEFDPVTR